MEFRLTMPSDLYATVLGAFAASMVVRVIVAILYSHARRAGTFLEECWSRFRGTHDYWHPFWLGALEVFGYTILLGNALPKYVGAWLALKTVSQWRRWGEKRETYTIFLIGNALVLFPAYAISKCPYVFPR